MDEAEERKGSAPTAGVPNGALVEADVGVASSAPSSGGATFVAVMQAAYLGEGQNLAGDGWLDRSGVRRILAEREVRARAVVVREVRPFVRRLAKSWADTCSFLSLATKLS